MPMSLAVEGDVVGSRPIERVCNLPIKEINILRMMIKLTDYVILEM